MLSLVTLLLAVLLQGLAMVEQFQTAMLLLILGSPVFVLNNVLGLEMLLQLLVKVLRDVLVALIVQWVTRNSH